MHGIYAGQCCGSGSGIRCLFDPWIRDLGSQTHTFESLVTIFWVKSSRILWKLAQIFFFSTLRFSPQVGADGELGPLSLGHLGHTLVPALDNLQYNKPSQHSYLLSVLWIRISFNAHPEAKPKRNHADPDLFVNRVGDPYSFFTDPDPEFDVGDQYGSGSGSRT
jgi:hypothetical protein